MRSFEKLFAVPALASALLLAAPVLAQPASDDVEIEVEVEADAPPIPATAPSHAPSSDAE